MVNNLPRKAEKIHINDLFSLTSHLSLTIGTFINYCWVNCFYYGQERVYVGKLCHFLIGVQHSMAFCMYLRLRFFEMFLKFFSSTYRIQRNLIVFCWFEHFWNAHEEIIRKLNVIFQIQSLAFRINPPL